jgi:hypothetical protein
MSLSLTAFDRLFLTAFFFSFKETLIRSCKYLGVLIHEKLKWTMHIELVYKNYLGLKEFCHVQAR